MIPVRDTQILGCERAYARSHPKIWPPVTAKPGEPESNLLKKKKLMVKYAPSLGSGVMATRHALDVKFKVQVLTPQPTNPRFGDFGLSRLGGLL